MIKPKKINVPKDGQNEVKGMLMWYQNGKLHREDGSAIISKKR